MEALRQFDAGDPEPSIRNLAAALRVAPSAIYHHFGSRAEIYQAAVEQVWGEATAGLLELEPKPFEADPREVLVATGIATRRAWLSHYRLAPFMAATPESNEFTRNALGLLANVFERLGLKGEEAAAGFHTYSSFMIGAVLFAAGRHAADQELEAEGSGTGSEGSSRSAPTHNGARRSSERTRISIDQVMEVAGHDPARDEEMFAWGLRRLVDSLAP